MLLNKTNYLLLKKNKSLKSLSIKINRQLYRFKNTLYCIIKEKLPFIFKQIIYKLKKKQKLKKFI